MNNRIEQLQRSTEAMIDAGVRKTTFYPLIAESLRMTKEQAPQLRRARALKHLLENVKLEVFPHELLGGSILGMWPVDEHQLTYDEMLGMAREFIAEHIHPTRPNTRPMPLWLKMFRAKNGDTDGKKLQMPRFALMARDHYNANADYIILQKVIKTMQEEYADSPEITFQEIAQVLEDNFQYDYGAEIMDEIYGLPWMVANHINLNYNRILCDGYGKTLEILHDYLDKTRDDPDKQEFYSSCIIAIESAIDYIRRYAKAYAEAAGTEQDDVRKAELFEIAKILEKVATEKPDTFREAMQLLWITHLIANTALGNALAFGRFDQYMYPFYQKDIRAGRITFDEAKELLCCLYLKINEPKMRTVQSMTLAGTTPDGRDAANELTRVCLAAARVVCLPYPNIAVCISREHSPDWLMDEAIKTIAKGFGMPQLVNDEHWVRMFTDLGHPEEYARQYYNMGCVENLIAGRHAGWLAVPNSKVSYPHLLNELMQEYKQGRHAFDTFDELEQAMHRKVREAIQACKVEKGHKFFNHAGFDPFGSVLTENCLEKGLDMHKGGAEIAGHIPVGGVGLVTAVDSLQTIRQLVYEEQKLTLDELIAAASDNYAGHESLRQYSLHTVEHFGNDLENVDDIAARLLKTFTTGVFNLNDGTIEEKYVSSYFSYTQSVAMGEITGTTFDGRLAGEPISDGLGPSQGRDKSGPTRLLNSLLKLDYQHMNGALATNIKISPSLFNTRSGHEALKIMLKTYLFSGGPQVQVNFVTQEDLIEAQTDPQKHRNLVVRIAGFCEHFIYLDSHQQNEIITRTAHEMQ